jgi:hypothetical protein
MIGYAFHAVRLLWLECGNRLALQAHRAGPTTVATSFCDGKEESPPSAAGAEEFRAQART